MATRQTKWIVRPGRIAAAVAVLGLWITAAFASVEGGRPLQLEVSINGEKTGLLGAFLQLVDGRLAARRSELAEIGVKIPSSGSADEIVELDVAIGGKFKYDEPTQAIDFTLANEQRIARAFDATGGPNEKLPVQTSWGSVLNYTLFGSETTGFDKRPLTFNGGSASLDGRVFSPFGTLSQTAILGTTTTRDLTALRLDTTLTYSDPESLITYRAGDAISGGLNWTRPIRFGGVQAQRNFGLRSDLVTAPLPSFSGSAAVPSTLDVYVNNTKTYTQNVPPGPFQVNNLPLVSGGEARLVLRDAAGREVETTLPFYTSARLLREGLTYFSGEAGLPRTHYGTQSDNYVEQAFASASVRHGLNDWLTLEGHAELNASLYNGGAGAVVRAADYGILSVAASGSAYQGQSGVQVYAGFETKLFGLSINTSTTRTFGDYNDLAAVTAPLPSSLLVLNLPVFASPLPPKAVDRVSIGMRLPDASSLGLNFIHLERVLSPDSNLFSASWSRPVFDTAHVFVTAFADVSQRNNYGLFAGISVPIGGGASLSTGATSSSTGTSVTTDASRPLALAPGSYGWRVRDSEGASAYRSAAGSYRSSVATVQAGVEQSNGAVRGIGQVEGAIAALGSGVFFSNRIDDSFAVVETGVPGVPVMYENRPAGETDKSGKLLIPNLRAYGKNKISIDPKNLPVNAEIDQVDQIIAPADRSGVVVKMGARTDVQAAVVILVGANGKPLPVGSKGQLEGGGEPFVVGYDGRAFVKELKAANTVVVTTDKGECRASFEFAASADRQVVVGPAKCQ